MRRLVAAVGPIALRERHADNFNAVARSIVFQQLAGAAALAIYNRFAALFEDGPTPQGVLALPETSLRGAGLSAAKTAALRDLALKSVDGTVPFDSLDGLDDEEIVSRLSAVRGVGRWTAEMFLIFQLRRPDVWPIDDLGVRRGYAIAHRLAELPVPKALGPLGEPFRPFRSAAAWYCWRANDTVLPD
ncbi:MAG TPA: DNA-3-methyladenine glycosylase 2 family protein [Candidatus Dormibacteraeota bacterium]